MLRRILLPALALTATLCCTPSASAADLGAYSGFPFGYGFYQPYGIRYSTSVRTPPYFAVNPPVYYGARHFRPYGASPFASLPLVDAGQGYVTGPAVEFVRPPKMPPLVNPYCETCQATEPADAEVASLQSPAIAPVRTNPYAETKVAQLQ